MRLEFEGLVVVGDSGGHASRVKRGSNAVKRIEQPIQESADTWEAPLRRPHFTLTSNNAHAVVQICRRLDGLPLAIELAASRSRLLTIEEISERLEHSLSLLSSTQGNRPSRHQTLNALIEWSYGLLTPDEQLLFERLSQFVGGFTLEAVEMVCNPDGGPRHRHHRRHCIPREPESDSSNVLWGATRFEVLEIEPAVTMIEEAVAVFRESGSSFHIAWGVGTLGQM